MPNAHSYTLLNFKKHLNYYCILFYKEIDKSLTMSILFRPVCKSKKILVYITESTMLRCMIAISSVARAYVHIARAYVHKAIAEIRVISNVILKIIASESN